MRKLFTLLLMTSCVMGLKAQGTFALAEGDAPKSGDQVTSVPNITMTYSEAGGADWNAAVADTHIDEGAVFGAYTSGNGVNGNKEGGTFVTFQPAQTGVLSVAVVVNADKKFFIEEDGVALDGFNEKVYSDKFYGVESFAVTAGKSYKVYVAGSKMGFYGFTYSFEGEEPAGYGFEGEGTEENPYLLKSAADFATLAAKINADNTGAGEYFQLANDIDFAGGQLPMIALDGITNVNKVEYAFEGVIDGQNYVISGVKHDQPNKADAYSSYVGIVSALGKDGEIKNLQLEGEIAGNLYVGTFAGLSAGTISNCINRADVTNTGAYGAGIVGSLIGGTGVVKASLNIGDITSEGGSYACGIVGGMQRHSSIEAYNYSIDFCDNYGDITSSGVGAAGIVGTGGGQIQNCYNYGKVTAGGQYAGGILACSNNEALTIKKCYNFGEVTGSSKTAGIAGELRNEATVLDGCYNVAVVEDGVVTGGGIVGTDADESKVKNIGGLVGNSTKEGAIVKHSASITAVTAPASVETAGHLAGTADIVLENCYFYAPDAALPLDNEAFAIADPLEVNEMWSKVFAGDIVALVMGQEIVFEDKLVTVIFHTSDVATIVIPELTYGEFVIDEFDVEVPYTATEDGCTFAAGEFQATAGDFVIDGTSISGTMTEKNLTLATEFTVGGMPFPLTVTFNGVADDETAIETIESEKAVAGSKFDLQGRRTEGKTGLFIENGKIYIVR